MVAVPSAWSREGAVHKYITYPLASRGESRPYFGLVTGVGNAASWSIEAVPRFMVTPAVLAAAPALSVNPSPSGDSP